ncbi:MAG: 3-dehydroquinate synthase [Flavobacteriales bacterium Tduv]
MRSNIDLDHSIYFGKYPYKALKNYISDHKYLSNIFILVDEHTKIHCLPRLFFCAPFLKQARLIEIAAGEDQKNIFTCLHIWKTFSAAEADRKSLLINLGGGVITDMGGFAASVFKRGIRFIHIPTTLLGMVDASIGGKTGIDMEGLKNEIGLFSSPEFLVIDINYLKTLPKRELRSGMAELLKHGLIADASLWTEMKKAVRHPPKSWQECIRRSVFIKKEIVRNDPTEKGLRKILNFGHTVGHAIETYFMNDAASLLHGEAIALGMICESWISCKSNFFPENQYEEISLTLAKHYPMRKLSDSASERILSIMHHDKKNESGKIRCSLLKTIGNCSYNHELEDDLIKESLNQLERFSATEEAH